MNKSISKSPPDRSGKILTVRIKLAEAPGRMNPDLRQFGKLTAQAERGNEVNDKNDKNDKYNKGKPT